ncbi:hypothetical protein L226DRAFT_571572 [Lentinus tigrinus ALCF2SS1-7]|uniref:Uncharacterized protein n=1 Tax=Lentinus tigrinus ALCF2SS1-6 TaxID=1328759 RepID=A0A5C2RTD1_9APHY|nr:hypothetical protein L227DRAFT_657243 [Lentinus tigrinus ALCF2SS1-6]RPD74105.1 hypothetical protein L226DRAFT_571572 [Lentinus tigrinus ALCF2SS1-7]
MALGQSTRSATPSSSPFFGAATSSGSTASPSSTSQDGPSNPPSLTPSSSSLPFSFLVTFIAIFLFFLGCGLGSRRVTRTFRRNLGLDVDDRGRGRAALVARERPLLWDVCPMDEKNGAHAWAQLRPLCASYVRNVPVGASASNFASSTLSPQAQTQPTRTGRPAEPEHTPSVLHWASGGMGAMGFAFSRAGLRHIPRPAPLPTSPTPRPVYPIRARPPPRPPQWHGHHVPGWLVRVLAGPAPVLQNAGLGTGGGTWTGEGEVEKQPVQALQVLTVITMPSPERAAIRSARAKAMEAGVSPIAEREGEARPSQCAEDFGEYVLGVARVSWDFGEVGAGGGER